MSVASNIPDILNIDAYRNDTLSLVITLTDSAGAAIDLSTAAMKMEVRTRPDGTVKLTLTEGAGLTVGGAGNNVVTVAKVVDIDDCGSYYYDLQATYNSGVVTTYLKGMFNVLDDITK